MWLMLSFYHMTERQLENRTQLSELTIIRVTAFNYYVQSEIFQIIFHSWYSCERRSILYCSGEINLLVPFSVVENWHSLHWTMTDWKNTLFARLTYFIEKFDLSFTPIRFSSDPQGKILLNLQRNGILCNGCAF